MRPFGGSLGSRSGRLHKRGLHIGCRPDLGPGLRFGNGLYFGNRDNSRFNSLPGFGGRFGQIGGGRFNLRDRLRNCGRHGFRFRFSCSHRLRNSGHLGTRGRRKSSYRLFGNGFNSLLNGQFSLCSGLHLSSCSSERRFLGDLVQRHGLRRFGFRRGERIKRQHLAQIQRLGHLERLGNGFRPDIFHWFRSCRDLRQRVSRRHEPECVVHPAQFFERQVAFQSIASAGYTPAINQLRQFPQSLLHTCQIHSRIHFAFKDRKKFRNTRPSATAFFRKRPIFGPENAAATQGTPSIVRVIR